MYSKHLGGRLKDVVAQFAEQPHHESVVVYEELAVSRALCAKALTIASIAMENDKTAVLGIAVARDALNQVRDMVLAASKIERDKQDKISLEVANQFVKQVIRAIYRVCKGDLIMAAALEEEINNTVRVPSSTSHMLEGVSSTPSDVVEGMDSMVVGEKKYVT